MKFFYVPVEELTKVTQGYVICNSYWIIDPLRGAKFYDSRKIGSLDLDRVTPQCNHSQLVAEHLKTTHEGCEVLWIAAAYIGNLKDANI